MILNKTICVYKYTQINYFFNLTRKKAQSYQQLLFGMILNKSKNHTFFLKNTYGSFRAVSGQFQGKKKGVEINLLQFTKQIFQIKI